MASAHNIKALKGFQERAVESGVALFEHAKSLLDAAPDDPESRARAVNHNGYLLIEAPTGSGKTLMAGHIVERFSHQEDVVWFWFAPFKGVVGQTTAFLREQYHGLRLRDLADDRDSAACRRGDVFVTTWQTVATRVKDRRNVRKDGELTPSIDVLIERLRAQRLRIGVVVDEAHHGFHGDTQAAKFFHDILSPEYTILVTATPDDTDIKEFEGKMGIAELQRISVSRQDAVDIGLIKVGVKCAAYMVDADKRQLVDLEGTALRDGVAAHRRIQRYLKESGVPLTPLLLVQVDSKDDEKEGKTEQSVRRVKERLLELGFNERQIAIHTAKEPDPDLLALANDEEREVLIFKMAVALGFDAPRAFTLVSMRASRDPDFGVQLVGRILRVHRMLQKQARTGALSDPLRFGYVFLADADSQTGLDIAGQRINHMRTEYAKISSATMVVRVGGQPVVGAVTPDGQPWLLQPPLQQPSYSENTPSPPVTIHDRIDSPEFDFGQFFKDNAAFEQSEADKAQAVDTHKHEKRHTGPYHYALRADAPRHFKTQIVCPNSDATEEDCAARFMVSTRDLFEAMKSSIGVQRRTLEVFTHQLEFDFVGADLAPERAAHLAQRALLKSEFFDARELRRALLGKMEAVMREEAMQEAENPDKVSHFLDMILATHPALLYEAQKSALAETAIVEEASELPGEIVSEEALPMSTCNVYGVLPSEMNSWERNFAHVLDHDRNRIVRWWHRNLPHKPWSVNVLLPDGRGFFPDFVVGVEGRKTEDGILLAEPKLNFARAEEVPKTKAAHKVYGRVLVLHQQSGASDWMVVRYDERSGKPVLERKFLLADAAGFS